MLAMMGKQLKPLEVLDGKQQPMVEFLFGDSAGTALPRHLGPLLQPREQPWSHIQGVEHLSSN